MAVRIVNLERMSTRGLLALLEEQAGEMGDSCYQSDSNPDYKRAHDMAKAIKREILKRTQK